MKEVILIAVAVGTVVWFAWWITRAIVEYKQEMKRRRPRK